jgi:hypothetical protein
MYYRGITGAFLIIVSRKPGTYAGLRMPIFCGIFYILVNCEDSLEAPMIEQPLSEESHNNTASGNSVDPAQQMRDKSEALKKKLNELDKQIEELRAKYQVKEKEVVDD